MLWRSSTHQWIARQPFYVSCVDRFVERSSLVRDIIRWIQYIFCDSGRSRGSWDRITFYVQIYVKQYTRTIVRNSVHFESFSDASIPNIFDLMQFHDYHYFYFTTTTTLTTSTDATHNTKPHQTSISSLTSIISSSSPPFIIEIASSISSGKFSTAAIFVSWLLCCQKYWQMMLSLNPFLTFRNSFNDIS